MFSMQTKHSKKCKKSLRRSVSLVGSQVTREKTLSKKFIKLSILLQVIDCFILKFTPELLYYFFTELKVLKKIIDLFCLIYFCFQ